MKDEFKYERVIYHNPYAKYPLPPDLFKDEGVKQLVPKERNDEYIIMDWIQNYS